MPINTRLLAAVVLMLCSTSCKPVQSAPPPPRSDQVETRLLFSQEPPGFSDPAGRKFSDVFLWSGLEKFAKGDPNRRMNDECFTASEPTSAGGILGFLAGPLIGLVSDKIKSDLDDALKQYAADSKASEQTSFYTADGSKIGQAWRCFRVTRIRTAPAATPGGAVTRTIEFDFVGEVAIVGKGNTVADLGDRLENAYGIKVRPLRVYLASPIAKGSRIGMSASLSVDAVWREGNVGKQGTIFTTPLLAHKFTRGAKGVWSESPYYFPLVGDGGIEDPREFPSWDRLPLMPLIPISTVGPSGTIVTLTADFTEVGDGDGKGFLKAVDSLFSKSQSDLNSAATKAAKQLVDPAAPTPPAKPQLFCGTITPSKDGNGNIIQWSQSDATACPG